MVSRAESFRLLVYGLERLVDRIDTGEDMSDEPYYPGLEGVIAGETGIATIAGGLQYRGYPIEELARDARFVEVAYLLLEGELPNQEQLADFQSILVESSELPKAVLDLIAAIPLHVSAMDVLRTGISALSHFDPQLDDHSRAASIAKTLRLLAQIPQLIAARHRLRQGLTPIEPNPELSFPANLLYLLTGKEPPASHERAMDVSLILYAEHEFNASTFTARVVTSTQSDLYSAITAAVGALKGPLHGGANERVMEVLEEVGSTLKKGSDPLAKGSDPFFNLAERAEAWVREALAQKRRIMGFGHRVYKTGDPRAVILKEYCAELAAEAGQTLKKGSDPLGKGSDPFFNLEEIAETIERIVGEEKGLPPNLDWPSARLYHYMGLEVDLYTPLFVVSRVVGWAAHVIEQAENNRLIRPRSRYTGPERRKFVPLSKRG